MKPCRMTVEARVMCREKREFLRKLVTSPRRQHLRVLLMAHARQCSPAFDAHVALPAMTASSEAAEIPRESGMDVRTNE